MSDNKDFSSNSEPQRIPPFKSKSEFDFENEVVSNVSPDKLSENPDYPVFKPGETPTDFHIPRHFDYAYLMGTVGDQDEDIYVEDSVAKSKRFATWKKFAIGIGLSLFVAVIIVVSLLYLKQSSDSLNAYDETPVAETPTAEEVSTVNTTPDLEVTPDSSFVSENVKGLPIVTSGDREIVVSPNGSSVVYKNADTPNALVSAKKLVAGVESCNVFKPTDFCYVGHTTVESSDDTENPVPLEDIFYFKDVTSTKVFNNTKNNVKVDAPGAQFAFSCDVEITGKKLHAIVYVNDDSSAWMVTSKQELDPGNFLIRTLDEVRLENDSVDQEPIVNGAVSTTPEAQQNNDSDSGN